MPNEKSAAIIRRMWTAENARKFDEYAKILDADYVWESDSLPESLRGPDAARKAVEGYYRAFPDLNFEIEQMISDGDFVVTRFKATGTHRAEFLGIAATGRSIEIRGCDVHQVKDGKAVRVWGYWDSGRLLRQLGVKLPG